MFSRKGLMVAVIWGLAGGMLFGSMAQAKSYVLLRNFPNRMPLSFMDANGKPTGFETELMQEIAKRAGLDVKEEFVSNLRAGLRRLREGNADLVMAAASITPERLQEFDFSEPYFQTSPMTIITVDSSVQSFADLRDLKVSVMQGSTHEKRILALQNAEGEAQGKTKEQGEVRPFESVFLALKDVMQGRSSAVLGDDSYMFGFIENYKSHNLRLVVDEGFAKDSYGIVMKKGDAELKAKVDAALQGMKQDGSYQRLVQKWYPGKVLD